MRMSTQGWARSDRSKGFKGSVDANSIPIGPIVESFGGEVREGKNVSVRCVLHNDSRRSAVIDTISNVYFCHTCGKGGNAVNLVCILESMEFKDGLKRAIEIAERGGTPIRSGNKSGNSSRARRTWDL